MKKILITGKRYNPFHGGIERQSENILNVLLHKDFSVDFLYFTKHRSELTVHDNIRLIGRHCRVWLSNVCLNPFILLSVLHEGYGTIFIHAPNPVVELVFLFVPKRRRLIIYYHCRARRWPIFGFFHRLIQKSLFLKADKIAVTTKRFLKYPELSRHKEKIVEIPNWVAPEFVAQRFYFKGVSPAPHLFFAGRLVWYKGLLTLIRSLKFCSAHLEIAGEGPLRRKIEKSIIEYGLQERVTFLGSISDEQLRARYDAAEIFVLPSEDEAEGFGITVIEAMARGVPVIVSDIDSGLADIVRDGTTGYVFRRGDAADLARVIEFAAENKEKTKKNAENAYNMVKSRYIEQKNVEKLEALFYNV